jgi:pyrrolidone-carboxylate peptidase
MPDTSQWLITSFEPFAGRPVNNSHSVMNEVVRIVSGETAFPVRIHTHVLPVEYDRCDEALLTEVTRLQQSGIRLSGVLSLGEGAEEFKLETRANNLDDVPDLADNAGVTREKSVIFPDLSPADTIPLRFPYEAFSRIRTSVNPGYFICNHLCARMGRHFQKNNDPYFGFIHVPRTGMGGMFTAEVCAAVIVQGLRKTVTS